MRDGPTEQQPQPGNEKKWRHPHGKPPCRPNCRKPRNYSVLDPPPQRAVRALGVRSELGISAVGRIANPSYPWPKQRTLSKAFCPLRRRVTISRACFRRGGTSLSAAKGVVSPAATPFAAQGRATQKWSTYFDAAPKSPFRRERSPCGGSLLLSSSDSVPGSGASRRWTRMAAWPSIGHFDSHWPQPTQRSRST